MLTVVALVFSSLIGVVLWEHFLINHRPSAYINALTIHLVSIATFLAGVWARVSDFITWLQLYELGQTVSRLATAVFGLFTDPIAAGHNAYWNYVHTCRYPPLVAIGSVLLFIGIEAVIGVVFVWPYVRDAATNWSNKDKENAGGWVFTLTVVAPCLVTVFSYTHTLDERERKERNAQKQNQAKAATRPGTPRPSTRISTTTTTTASQ